MGMAILKFLLSIVSFIIIMVLSLFAFTYTVINYPSLMRDFMTAAQQVRDHVRELALPDNYMVWVDIYMQPSQIVLVGISIAMRVLVGILAGLLRLMLGGGGMVAAAQAPRPGAQFGSWG